MTKFSKEQNELKMREVRDFAANTATGKYHLNVHVIGLNYYSTFEEMIKGYRSMARRFHPDLNCEIYKPWNDSLLSFLQMLNNNSNQEHVNSSDTDPLQYWQKNL